jgi:hypothetical protein
MKHPAAAVASVVAAAWAVAGTPAFPAVADPGFGNGGVVTNAHPLAIERDGDVIAVLAGGRLVRLAANGTKLPFAYQPRQCQAIVATRSDGKLVAACGGTLMRLTGDGRADGGRATLPDVTFTALAVAQDGTIAAAARTGSPPAAVLLRFLPDGTPSTAFGRVTIAGREIRGQALAVDSAGRILVANGALHRFLADGQPDTSFSAPAFAATVIALTRDGRILACCSNSQMMRLLSSGEADTSFGALGIASIGEAGSTTTAGGLVPEPDGGAVLVGTQLFPCRCYYQPVEYYAQRIHGDGSAGAFGESPGFFDPDTDCWDEYGDWAGLEPNGTIVAGGGACEGAGDYTFAMRYTAELKRDYGPFLTLDVHGGNAKTTVAERSVVITATIVVNHGAQLTAYLRASDEALNVFHGPRLLLSATSSFGARRLHQAATSISTTTTHAGAQQLRLVLPRSAVVPRHDYALVVQGRRPGTRYTAIVESFVGRP